MDLTEDEVLEILKLIEESNFDFLNVEVGDLKLTVSKGGFVPDMSGETPIPAVTVPVEVRPDAPPEPSPPAKPPAGEDLAGREGLVPVTAPMVGTFYAAPDPESPAFVEKGARVDGDTTMGLIEVMKVFTAIRAGISGVIAEVLVSNAEFVEYGQDLFLIEPEESAKDDGASG
jgi:acetyl-CoA carboxylase biotin carboxyl carrier protein